MAKTIDPALAERLRHESEQTKDDVYPAGTTLSLIHISEPTRPY